MCAARRHEATPVCRQRRLVDVSEASSCTVAVEMVAPPCMQPVRFSSAKLITISCIIVTALLQDPTAVHGSPEPKTMVWPGQ